MTLQIDGTDVGGMIEIAVWVGGIVAMLAIGLMLYLLVRPPRRSRQDPPADDRIETEEMLRLMERMEARLETLERAVSADGDRAPARKLTNGKNPETRREE